MDAAGNLSWGTLEAQRAEIRGQKPRAGKGSWGGVTLSPIAPTVESGERC